MPGKNSHDKVHRCVKDVEKEGKDESAAIGICSASTGIAYNTGKAISKEAKDRHMKKIKESRYGSQAFLTKYLFLKEAEANKDRPHGAGGDNGLDDDPNAPETKDAQGNSTGWTQKEEDWWNNPNHVGSIGPQPGRSAASMKADPAPKEASLNIPSPTVQTPQQQQAATQLGNDRKAYIQQKYQTGQTPAPQVPAGYGSNAAPMRQLGQQMGGQQQRPAAPAAPAPAAPAQPPVQNNQAQVQAISNQIAQLQRQLQQLQGGGR